MRKNSLKICLLPVTRSLAQNLKISPHAPLHKSPDRNPKMRHSIPTSLSISLVARASSRSWNACIGQRENSNVIVLSKCLCGAGNGIRRLGAESSRSIEAKQRTGLVAGFDYAIGE